MIDQTAVQKCVNWFADAIHASDPAVAVTTGAWTFKVNSTVNRNRNYYSDAALRAVGGRDNGTLDFYEVHYYDNFVGSEIISPFLHPASYWGLDKPIVIGEFLAIDTNGISAADLYTTLFDNGYAGAWAWQYISNGGAGQIKWPAMQVPMQNLLAAHQDDLVCPMTPPVALPTPARRKRSSHCRGRRAFPSSHLFERYQLSAIPTVSGERRYPRVLLARSRNLPTRSQAERLGGEARPALCLDPPAGELSPRAALPAPTEPGRQCDDNSGRRRGRGVHLALERNAGPIAECALAKRARAKSGAHRGNRPAGGRSYRGSRGYRGGRFRSRDPPTSRELRRAALGAPRCAVERRLRSRSFGRTDRWSPKEKSAAMSP